MRIRTDFSLGLPSKNHFKDGFGIELDQCSAPSIPHRGKKMISVRCDIPSSGGRFYTLSKLSSTLTLVLLSLSTLFLAPPAAAQNTNDCVALQQTGNDLLFDQDHPAEALEQYEAALTCYREGGGDLQREGLTLLVTGLAHDNLTQYQQAATAYQESLAIQRELGQADREGLTLYLLGSAYSNLDDTDQALSNYLAALPFYRQDDDQETEASLLVQIGYAYQQQESYEDAATYYQQALDLQRSLEDQAGEADTLITLGFMYYSQDAYEDALATFEQMLTIRQTLDDRSGEAYAYYALGLVYDRQDDYEAAQNSYEQALTIYRELEDRENEALILYSLALIYYYQDRYPEAIELNEQALVIRQDLEILDGAAAVLQNLGLIYEKQARYEETIEIYEQALTIYRALGQTDSEAGTLSNLGDAYRNQALYEQALETYEQALAISHEMDNPEFQASILSKIGDVYGDQGEYEAAVEQYEQTLLIYQDTGNQEGRVITLNNLGFLYEDQEQYSEALQHFEQALAINRELGNTFGEALTLDYIGNVYRSQANYNEALAAYDQALAIHLAEENKVSEAIMLSRIGEVFRNQYRYDEAETHYQLALEIQRELQNRSGERLALGYLGGVYEEQARYAEALQVYQQSLLLNQELGDQSDEAITLMNIGSVYEQQGRYDVAFEAYEQALEIRQAEGEQRSEAFTLRDMASVLAKQNRFEEALGFYQQALEVNQAIENRREEAAILNRIGELYRQQMRYEESLELYEEALANYQAVEDRDGERATLRYIGQLYAEQDQYDEALSFQEQDLAIALELEDIFDQSFALRNMADVYAKQGEFDQAFDLYNQALTLQQTVGRRLSQMHTLRKMGQAYEAQGDGEQASTAYQQALDILEEIRATAGSEEGRADFINQYASLYGATVTLAHREGDGEEAFLLSERSRARAFLDTLATGQVVLSDNEAADLLLEEQAIFNRQQAVQDDLARARLANPANPELVANLETTLAETQQAYSDIQAAIADYSDQLALTFGRDEQNLLDVAGVQAQLNEQTTLISYYVLEEQTLAFVITSNAFTVIELTLTAEQLTSQVAQFRDIINLNQPEVLNQVAQSLYQQIIEPLTPQLNTPRLLIAPHSSLHYLPFTALYDAANEQYLIERHEVVVIPSASALPFIQQNAEDQGQTEADRLPALVVGNPTTGDYDATASLATQREGLGSLPFAEKEAEAIASLYGVEPLVGQDATEGAVREQVSIANILHLAAHGAYNPVSPLSSLVALAPDDTYDGWLTVGEIYGLDLQQTELVVLSACQTQLGELSAGDELVGLTRAFMFAGTPNVIATLWNVDDTATGDLMEKFYNHLQAGQDKATALRQAQLDLITEGTYADPYYWSAFVLSGDGGEVGATSPQPQVGVTGVTGAIVDPEIEPDTSPVEATPAIAQIEGIAGASERESESTSEPTAGIPWGTLGMVGGLVIGGLIAVGVAGSVWWRRRASSL